MRQNILLIVAFFSHQFERSAKESHNTMLRKTLRHDDQTKPDSHIRHESREFARESHPGGGQGVAFAQRDRVYILRYARYNFPFPVSLPRFVPDSSVFGRVRRKADFL